MVAEPIRQFQEVLIGLTFGDIAAVQAERGQRDFQAHKQSWQQLRQAQAELRRLALAGADDRTLSAKQTEVQNLLGQMTQARVNTLQQIGPIPSPEQREAYAIREELRHADVPDAGPIQLHAAPAVLIMRLDLQPQPLRVG